MARRKAPVHVPRAQQTCTCGHKGRDHDDPIGAGIGYDRCTVAGCTCIRFTWQPEEPGPAGLRRMMKL